MGWYFFYQMLNKKGSFVWTIVILAWKLISLWHSPKTQCNLFFFSRLRESAYDPVALASEMWTGPEKSEPTRACQKCNHYHRLSAEYRCMQSSTLSVAHIQLCQLFIKIGNYILISDIWNWWHHEWNSYTHSINLKCQQVRMDFMCLFIWDCPSQKHTGRQMDAMSWIRPPVSDSAKGVCWENLYQQSQSSFMEL